MCEPWKYQSDATKKTVATTRSCIIFKTKRREIRKLKANQDGWLDMKIQLNKIIKKMGDLVYLEAK